MEEFKLELLKPDSHVHFIGIGGISMSALAEILTTHGFTVSGSDMKRSSLTDKLEKLGVKIFIGHSEANIKGADLVVYTAAIKPSNPELEAARQLNIPNIERPILLGELMKNYSNAIAVSGTHGKTTTTSMISSIMLNAKLNPTILVGGELDEIGGNVHTGDTGYFITEACEYVESFLKFHPNIAAILNIEEDHLDYFKNLNHIIDAFRKFAKLIPKDGYIIACGDDNNVAKAIEGIDCNILTYGIKDRYYDWKAQNIHFDELGYPNFEIIHKGEKLSSIRLSLPGIHNVYNALAAIACTYALGVDIDSIVESLSVFKGTHRRFEIKSRTNNLVIVDDYAHHPTEIKATLQAASKFPHNKVWCVFQPHTYTRTYALLNEFSGAFSQADHIIITDIYAARERNDGRVHSTNLLDKLLQNGCNAKYISNFDDISLFISQNVSKGDLIITMGAGDIYRVGEMLIEKFNIRDEIKAMA